MTWFRLDDKWHSHPKVIAADRELPGASGLFARAGCWSADQEADGFVPIAALEQLFPTQKRWRERAVGVLVKAGLFDVAPGGWMVHDFVEDNAPRDLLRARRALFGNRSLLKHVRERDGEFCRFCGDRVSFQDHRGPRGGTYVHIDPMRPTVVENVVVSCRACSRIKGYSLPGEVGLDLLPQPAQMRLSSELNGAANGSAPVAVSPRNQH